MRGRQLTQYFLEHRISLFQRIIIPKPDHPKALRLKICRPLGIAAGVLRMLPAVDFHYELLIKADKIGDVRRNRMLAPKLESAEVAVFQSQPKPQFRVG